MVRKLAVLGVCFAVGLSAVSFADDKKKDDKTPTIKEIMKQVPNKGMNKGLAAKCLDAADAGKWEDCQKMAAELKTLGESMGKNPCPKGSQESWEKLTKQFGESMGEIEKAAKDKDAAAVKKAVGTFTKSCKTCHDEHRGK